MHAINFLTAVSRSVHHALFEGADTLRQICESIVIPNLRMREDMVRCWGGAGRGGRGGMGTTWGGPGADAARSPCFSRLPHNRLPPTMPPSLLSSLPALPARPPTHSAHSPTAGGDV